MLLSMMAALLSLLTAWRCQQVTNISTHLSAHVLGVYGATLVVPGWLVVSISVLHTQAPSGGSVSDALHALGVIVTFSMYCLHVYLI